MSSILALQTPARGLRSRQPSDDTWKAELTAATHGIRHAVTRPSRPAPFFSHITGMHCAKLPCTCDFIPLLPRCSCTYSWARLTRTTLHEHLLLPSSLNMPVFALAAVQLCTVHAPYQPCEPCFGRHATIRPSHHPSTTRHVHDFTTTPTRDAPMLLTLTRSGCCSTPCS
jgi:hypothetical protein